MAENPHLSKDELKRYARHISLPLFGIEGQKKLRKSSVLCIGAGGLGSMHYVSSCGGHWKTWYYRYGRCGRI